MDDTQKTYRYIVGIDPDSDKNGVACLNVVERSLSIKALAFPHALEYLARLEPDTLVVIEAGWLNKSNWHLNGWDSKVKAAAKGNAVGRNHEVGRKLAEMCEHWHIPYRLARPLKKMWQGPEGKITATELEAFTGYKGRTNQEGRDAALLAWVEAGFTIKTKSK